MKTALIYFLLAFLIAAIISLPTLWGLRRIKAGQQILSYVEEHKKKSGTPTMGGIIFIIPLIVLSFFALRKSSPLALIVVLSSLSYALLGFLDDFIKIRNKNNQGLKAYQKFIGQGGIAILVSIFYFMVNPEGRIIIPFFNDYVDIGWTILPLTLFVLVSTTNSVNLTDGLDGLAGSVSLVYLVFIALMIGLLPHFDESATFVNLAAISCGGLLCYLMFNTNKASVFMGDTGSLYLGGLIASISMFSFLGFYILILGIMFVVSAVSDIIQVGYFKTTKGKRVFLMAPFHHHLERKGMTEAKIVSIYCAITVIMGIISIVTFI